MISRKYFTGKTQHTQHFNRTRLRINHLFNFELWAQNDWCIAQNNLWAIILYFSFFSTYTGCLPVCMNIVQSPFKLNTFQTSFFSVMSKANKTRDVAGNLKLHYKFFFCHDQPTQACLKLRKLTEYKTSLGCQSIGTGWTNLRARERKSVGIFKLSYPYPFAQLFRPSPHKLTASSIEQK